MAVGAVVGGWFIQCCVFSFNEVFILEEGVAGFIGLFLLRGFIVVFVWSFRGFGKKLLGGSSGGVKHLRTFFLCMIYTAYVVPLFNMFGLGLAKVCLEEVDMG